MEVLKKEGSVLEGEKARASDKVKSLKQEIASLQERQKQLLSEIEAKSKEIRTEKTSGIARQKQSSYIYISDAIRLGSYFLPYAYYTVAARVTQNHLHSKCLHTQDMIRHTAFMYY